MYRYAIMRICWSKEPKDRPTFSELVASLSQTLMGMSDYMDFNMTQSTLGAHESSSDPSRLPAVADSRNMSLLKRLSRMVK